jgi:hypothetical protein
LLLFRRSPPPKKNEEKSDLKFVACSDPKTSPSPEPECRGCKPEQIQSNVLLSVTDAAAKQAEVFFPACFF